MSVEESLSSVTSIDSLLNRVCEIAHSKGIHISQINHAFIGRELINRPPSRNSPTLISLRESGWEDLTMVCDISDDGNIERRLMRDPRGDFHIVSEHFIPAKDVWELKTETVTPSRARHFYVTTCIPESLANGFMNESLPNFGSAPIWWRWKLFWN